LSAVVLPQPPAAHTDWRELWLITVGHGLTHWYPATFYLLLPLIGNELGLSYSQIGLIMTCNYIAAAIANIPAASSWTPSGAKAADGGVAVLDRLSPTC
jgi:hypothetical protein